MPTNNPFDASDSKTPALADGGPMASLQGMRPWQSFLSVIGFAISGLMLVSGLAMCAGAMFQGSTGLAALSMGQTSILGVLYLIPSRYLWRSAKALKAATYDPELAEAHIHVALDNQHKFWSFAGVMTALSIVIYLVAMAILAVL